MSEPTNPLLSQETINRLMTWFITGDTGLSSKCMAATIMSQSATLSIKSYEARAYPLDGSDLNRCVKLLKKVPELREHLWMMSQVSPHWDILVKHWDELEKILEVEIKYTKIRLPNEPKPKSDDIRGSTYRRMKELYASLDLG